MNEKPPPSTRPELLRLSDIRIRDPFVLPDAKARLYYMYAGMHNRRRGAKGWEVYVSRDLEHWRPPVAVFTPPKGFWGVFDFWAPEVHAYKGRYYLFGTLRGRSEKRGTQIFVADRPTGPFRPHSDKAITPHDWFALDGTLWVEDGHPWMVFCHEWVQVGDGTMEAMRLSDDLSKPAGRPTTLFKASDAKWVRPVRKNSYVTDGPFLHRASNGRLLMLWSSFGAKGYAVGAARSASGRLAGPWRHADRPLYADDGGHPMLFRRFDGRLTLAIHQPNRSPRERAKFLAVGEKDGALRLAAPPAK